MQVDRAWLAEKPAATPVWPGKGQAHKRIGNSVPPLLMRAIARHLRRTVLDPLSGEDDS